jgi:hypothetical protein
MSELVERLKSCGGKLTRLAFLVHKYGNDPEKIIQNSTRDPCVWFETWEQALPFLTYYEIEDETFEKMKFSYHGDAFVTETEYCVVVICPSSIHLGGVDLYIEWEDDVPHLRSSGDLKWLVETLRRVKDCLYITMQKYRKRSWEKFESENEIHLHYSMSLNTLAKPVLDVYCCRDSLDEVVKSCIERKPIFEVLNLIRCKLNVEILFDENEVFYPFGGKFVFWDEFSNFRGSEFSSGTFEASTPKSSIVCSIRKDVRSIEVHLVLRKHEGENFELDQKFRSMYGCPEDLDLVVKTTYTATGKLVNANITME